MRRIIPVLILILTLCLIGCGAVSTQPSGGNMTGANMSGSTGTGAENKKDTKSETTDMIRLIIGDHVITARLADTPAAKELAELLKDGPVIMSASNYGGFEKVCRLGRILTQDDVETTTEAGDIMLYSGDQIVVFYASNSWAYTRLAKVIDEDIPKLSQALPGDEDEVIIELAEVNTTEKADGKTLVVCFSCTGNTKPIAEMAADILGADFYEIVPEVPYTAADIRYQDDSCRANREQDDPASRPAISGETLDISAYDSVVISFPIWWGKEPRIIDTFLDTYDLSGKKLAAFCTSGSSGIETAERNLKAAEPDAEWLGARRFQTSVSKNTVSDWLADLGMK